MAWRLDVQGLRGIAVLLVIAFHANLGLCGGFVGVDMFFVISGFLITGTLCSKLQNGKPREVLQQYFVSRFWRLFPAMAVVVVVVMAASVLVLSPISAQSQTLQAGMSAMFFASNVAIFLQTGDYFSPAAENNALLHLWSLSLEEQIFLVFPMVLVVALVIARKNNYGSGFLVSVICALSLISFLVAVSDSFLSVDLFGWNFLQGFYSPVSRFWEFGLGATVALVSFRISTIHSNLIGLAGVSAVIVSATSATGGTHWPGVETLIPAMGTVLIIVSGINRGSVTNKLLGGRGLVWLGSVSYSRYL